MSRIPRIVHFCFGLAQDFGGKTWSLIHHTSVASAVARLKPDQVFFYYEYEPSGPWWQLTKQLVTPVQIEAPREIFGRPLTHPAHRADVVRIEKLIEHGGIYLDADVMVHRDFDDLLDNSTVLGQEGFGSGAGLCNAIILAEPNSPFLRRWHAEYKWFRGSGKEYWNEHSVMLPAKLADEHPDEITILPPTAFFWPLWSAEHIEWLFNSDEPIPDTGAYANHLWESKAWKYLEFLTPGQVRDRNTNFHRWARPYVKDLTDDLGSASINQQLVGLIYGSERWLRSKVKALGKRAKGQQPINQRLRNVAHRGSRRLQSRVSDLRHTVRGPGTIAAPLGRREIFEKIYVDELWGRDGESRFFSGVGSRGSAVEEYVRNMTAILKEHEAALGRPLTVVDVGCGDFVVGRGLVEALPALRYIGCDIVPSLIEHHDALYSSDRVSFVCLDVVTDHLPDGDVCLVRQVFQHLSNKDIAQALLNLDAFEVAYVSEGQPQVRTGAANPDKLAGAHVRFDWRRGVGRGVELGAAPFSRTAKDLFGISTGHELIVTTRVVTAGHSKSETAVAASAAS